MLSFVIIKIISVAVKVKAGGYPAITNFCSFTA
jgi:hypothetical protein